MSHKDAVHNDPFVCLIRLRLNPYKKVVMRRPASLLSVEKNGGRGKRRARSECEFNSSTFDLQTNDIGKDINKQMI